MTDVKTDVKTKISDCISELIRNIMHVGDNIPAHCIPVSVFKLEIVRITKLKAGGALLLNTLYCSSFSLLDVEHPASESP